MSSTLRLAMIQQSYAAFDRDGNISKAEEAIRKAAADGAQIVCLPEMFLTGYPMYRGQDGKPRRVSNIPIDGFQPLDEATDEQWGAFAKRVRDTAERSDGPYARRLAELAEECGVHLVAGVCESHDGMLYNSALLFGPDGRHIGTYRKVHVCRWWPAENLCQDGDDWRVWPVMVGGGLVRIGIMICCDREYPESARALMLNGAEIILVPNAGGINERRIAQVQIRAFENAVAIAMANHAEGYDGNSVIVDFNGDIVARAGKDEELLAGRIDFSALREKRSRCLWADRFRRPHTYSTLSAVHQPRIP